MSNQALRLPTQATLEEYLKKDIEGIFAVDGTPQGRLVVNPRKGTLAIRLPVDSSVFDLAAYKNISADIIKEGSLSWHQVTVRISENITEAYSVLMLILDKVQIEGQPLALAIEEVLSSLNSILSERTLLTHEKQIGLFGELVVLASIISEFGKSDGLNAWKGPCGEEHDFGLPEFDLEVKSTAGERRQHWISSLTQLEPTPNRTLYLTSIQITAAGLGTGASLPELVLEIRDQFPQQNLLLERLLRLTGYRDIDAKLYGHRWNLRSSPQFYVISELFPALTATRLRNLGTAAERISDVRYRIDVTDWPSAQPPITLELESTIFKMRKR